MGDDIDFFVRGGVKIFNIRIFRVIFYIDFIIFLWGLCPVLSPPAISHCTRRIRCDVKVYNAPSKLHHSAQHRRYGTTVACSVRD